MNWSIRKHATVGLVTVAVLLLGIGVFGLFGSLSGAVIASGQVALETHAQIVQHPDGGVVAEIRVKDGDTVRAGDVLLSLDGSSLLSDRAILSSQIHDLEARATRLQAETLGTDRLVFPDPLQTAATTDPAVAEMLAGQQAVFAAGLRTFAATIDSTHEQQGQIRREIDGLKAQSNALADQVDLVDAEYDNAAALLEKGLTEAPRVSELKRNVVSLSGQQAQAESQIAASLAEIARLDVEVARLTSARQEKAVTELRDVETKLAELTEQQSLITKKITRLEMRAPRAGIVQGLQIHTIGAVIRPADPVLSVVPQDGLFTIIAKVDAQKVDSVFVGQEAALRFSAFDTRTTPEILARITRVSADIVTDSRTGAQYYTAEAAPNPGEIAKLGDKVLLPGMPVEVYIQTGARSPLSYLLKPFLDYVERAFKE